MAIPKIKVKEGEDAADISEALADKIKINKRRRRLFKRSFYYAKNIIEFTKEELNRQNPINIYSGATLKYFEERELRAKQIAFQNVAEDLPVLSNGSPDKFKWQNS